jgi:hypothetical protein
VTFQHARHPEEGLARRGRLAELSGFDLGPHPHLQHLGETAELLHLRDQGLDPVVVEVVPDVPLDPVVAGRLIHVHHQAGVGRVVGDPVEDAVLLDLVERQLGEGQLVPRRPILLLVAAEEHILFHEALEEPGQLLAGHLVGVLRLEQEPGRRLLLRGWGEREWDRRLPTPGFDGRLGSGGCGGAGEYGRDQREAHGTSGETDRGWDQV